MLTLFLEKKNYEIYDNFDQFVRGMSYWSSYSGGVAMWKSDFESLDLTKPFNELFPHIDISSLVLDCIILEFSELP